MIKNILLIGMPGSGKSKIGFLLSKKLKMDFIDMDEYIEQTENKTIKEMFDISEDYFRDKETKCSKNLSKLNSNIIACGGGIVKRKENIQYFKEGSIIVFINRPIENILQDIETDKRPLLAHGEEKLFRLYDERIELYKKYCDIEISNIGELSSAVNQVIEKLKEFIY